MSSHCRTAKCWHRSTRSCFPTFSPGFEQNHRQLKGRSAELPRMIVGRERRPVLPKTGDEASQIFQTVLIAGPSCCLPRSYPRSRSPRSSSGRAAGQSDVGIDPMIDLACPNQALCVSLQDLGCGSNLLIPIACTPFEDIQYIGFWPCHVPT